MSLGAPASVRSPWAPSANWLSVRVSQVRRAQQILHGDGGSPALLKRMRAHSNYGENLPVFLILLVLLELAGVWSLP